MIYDDTHLVATALFSMVVAGAVMGFGLAYVAWRHGETPPSRRYAVLMAINGVWCSLYAVVLGSPSFEFARAVSTLVIGTSLVSVIQWLRFCTEYTGYEERIPRTAWTLISIEAAAYFALVVTNRFHGLVFPTVESASYGPLLLVHPTVTWLVWLQISLIYAAVGAGLLMLVVFFARTRTPFRKQAGAIAVGATVMSVGNVLFLVGFSPHPDLDLTPIFFVGNGVVIWWALFHYDFLSVAPYASNVLLDEMDDPVVVVDEDDDVLDYNPAAVTVLDVDTDEAVGTQLSEAIPGLVAAIETDEPYATEANDGTRRVYDAQWTTFSDHHDVSRGRLVVLRDVTVQKRRERTLEALQSATRELIDAETEEEIAEIITATADDALEYPYAGVLRYDPEDDVLRPAALADELSTITDDEKLVVHRDEGLTWDVFETGQRHAFSSEELTEMKYDLPVERLLVFPLGDYGVFGVGSPSGDHQQTDDDLRFLDLLGTAAQTAFDRLDREEALRESQHRLEERKRQIEFFNGILRHDVLNGLTVVQGNAELLEEHVDAEGRVHLQRIHEWSEDMAALVDRVRSTIQAVTDSDGGALEPMDLSAVVERKVSKVRNTYESVSVSVDVPTDVRVRGDELLDEVVENVCTNAVEHNDGPAPEIRITASESEDLVTLRIADDGPGISEELRATVFDADATSDANETLGFGLYFVKVMMDRYGGDVRLEEPDTGGTAVVLEFVPVDAPGMASEPFEEPTIRWDRGPSHHLGQADGGGR